MPGLFPVFLTVSLTWRDVELIMTPQPILIKSFHIIDFTQKRQNIFLIFSVGVGILAENVSHQDMKGTQHAPLQD